LIIVHFNFSTVQQECIFAPEHGEWSVGDEKICKNVTKQPFSSK
jgi:hypothetical protein